MGRRKEAPQGNGALQAYFIALLHRWAEVTGGHEDVPGLAGVRLETLLQSAMSLPELRDIARDLQLRINGLTERQWKQAVVAYLELVTDLIGNLAIEQGWDPEIGRLGDRRARIRFVLSAWGWNEGVASFARMVKRLLSELLDKVASGNAPSMDWLQGIFTTELDRSLKIMNFSLLAYGGQPVIDAVATATDQVRDRLIASPEFSAAVEAMEAQHHWGETSPDKWFAKAWGGVGKQTMARIRGRRLDIPDERFINRDGRRDWSGEQALAQEAVFSELKRRSSVDPVGVLRDAWQGKLANSLAAAAENDIRDRIKYSHAQKRDVSKELGLETTITKDKDGKSDSLANRLASLEPDPLDKLVGRESLSELLADLDEGEAAVVDALDRGKQGKEIAVELGRSPSWVSKKKNSAKAKILSKGGAVLPKCCQDLKRRQQ